MNHDRDEKVLAELTQDSNVKTPTPAKEYKKALNRRRGKAALFILIILLEAGLCFLLLGGTLSEHLHYRVTKELENSLTGQNQFDTGIYLGETDFGYFTGDGTFSYVSGSVYTGHWDNDAMNGFGTLQIPSEGRYEGEFSGNLKSGEGTFYWDDGSVYEGEWKNDQMCGQGTYQSNNGVLYSGTFSDNHFLDGTCTFENETGTYTATYQNAEIEHLSVLFSDGTRYSGASTETSLCGTGMMEFPNMDCYTGNFEEGLRNGQGIYIWSTGDQYDGAWEKDAMSGSGTYTFADGSVVQGKFEQNQFTDGSYQVKNDFGEYTFQIENKKAVSVKMVLKSGTTYSGDIKDGELTGSAQITYSNGDQYSGRVESGMKVGQGTYIWCSGASYEGNWADDQMHGQGTYFYPASESGYKLTGNFQKGVPNGECRYYTSAIKSYKTDWSNGWCVKIYE